MSSSPIEEIKNRLDIVEVIGGYIKLQKCGVNYRALCPFHSEKKPSFFVSPTRQMWHCFGSCSEGGDVFKFIMKIEGVEFGDALRILAQRAGVELKKQDPKLKTERKALYEINELATEFFETQLEQGKIGKQAKKYLLDRNINEQSIKKWRLGYAPDSWHGLCNFLKSQGYKEEEIEKAGLIIKKEQGGWYDRFRGRIMFPIFDLNSQVVGFTGRIFGKEEEAAKYVNSPGTLLYDKSRILYGLDKARMAIRKKDQCILVEGQTDVIMSHQAGIENAVATSGTALTFEQLRTLKRYSNNLLTAFDMDVAGDSATKRGIDSAQTLDFNIKVIVMPKEKDPADIISKSPEKWEELIKNGKSIMDFYFETTFTKFDSKAVEGKKEISRILLPIIKRIPNKIEQSHWIKQIAEKLGVEEKDAREEFKKISSYRSSFEVQSDEAKKAGNNTQKKSRKQMLEEGLVCLILQDLKNLELISENDLIFFSPRIQKILLFLKQNKTLDLKAVSMKFKKGPKEIEDTFNYLCLKAELEKIDRADLRKEIETYFKEIKTFSIKNQLSQVSKEIREAEAEKKSKKLNVLVQKFNQLSQELINL